jgi:hypothetical protein
MLRSRNWGGLLRGGLLWSGTVGLGVLVNCGGKSPPAEQPARESDAASEPASSVGDATQPGARGEVPTSGDSGEPVESAEPGRSASGEPSPADQIGLICAKTCQRVEKNCSEKQGKFCHASCRDYVAGAEHCPVEIHGALSCQQSAEDFQLCANISDEACVPLFRKMVDCRTGKAKPRVWGDTSLDAKTDFAKGFTALDLPGYSMTQLMPDGTKVPAGSPLKIEVPDGAGRFLIEAVPLEGKVLSAPTMLRTVTKYVGLACQPKLRLHGKFESGHVMHSRFDTICKDGTEYHGVAHFWPDRALMVSHVGPASANLEEGRRDAFLFGFHVR